MDDVETQKRLKTLDQIRTASRIFGILLSGGALFWVWWAVKAYAAKNNASIMDKIRDPGHINMALIGGCLIGSFLVTVILAIRVIALERAESK
jgi:hypothetical protein